MYDVCTTQTPGDKANINTSLQLGIIQAKLSGYKKLCSVLRVHCC